MANVISLGKLKAMLQRRVQHLEDDYNGAAYSEPDSEGEREQKGEDMARAEAGIKELLQIAVYLELAVCTKTVDVELEDDVYIGI
jgi:hypothetical protein